MPIMNDMTLLLNKIERRLGTKQLNLPEHLQKDHWAQDVICNETLDTFSRYFPRKMRYVLSPENKKGPWYLIDESICESVKIIGTGDIDWREWSHHYPGLMYGGVNSYDMMTSGVDLDTFADIQMMADHVSAFTNGIYLVFEEPNKIKLENVLSCSFLTNYQRIPIELFVKHAPNLKTIPASSMESFESLALADVATFIYEELKMMDGLQTVYANVDLKLQSLEEKARMRERIIEEFERSYVSAANKAQPIMITIN